MVIEEVLNQHSKMASLHPASVNTIRITTVSTQKRISIMSATLRMSNDNSVIDNRSSGEICAAIEPKKGVVYTKGFVGLVDRYVYHPTTGTQIVGFKIPYGVK